jgi:hypothetical protein
LKFKLGRKALVEFTVLQVSPVCRLVGRFTVRGHAGLNRVRFNGRVHGTQLAAGTYRISARARGGTILRATLVLVDARAPSSAELALAQRSNVCSSSGVLGVSSTRGSFVGAGGGGQAGGLPESTIIRHQKPGESSGSSDSGSSSGSDRGRPVAQAISRAVENATNPVVIALLGLAMLMFGVSALPRGFVADPRMMTVVASHRIELAMAGTAALGAAVVAMLLG